MRRFRTQWLAAFGAALLLALSVSGALGARPLEQTDGEPNRGLQVSAFVHALIFGEEEVDEEEIDEEEVDEEEVDEEEVDEEEVDEEEQLEQGEHPENHGACVREVAHSDEAGGPNENHGGAVSLAARITCWEAFADPEADTGDEVTDGGQSEELSEDEATEDEVAAKPGKSAAAHERNAERTEARIKPAHGNGRGGGRH